MNKDGGFIKVYRSMLKWEWHDEPVTVATWMYCLMRANYTAERWHGEIIQPGQFVTSLSHMAQDIGITVGQLRTAMNHLKTTQNITWSATQRATLVTIENWGEYQSAGDKVAQAVARQPTSCQHPDNIQTTTIKEREERKERKKNINNIGAFATAWSHEPIKQDNDLAGIAHKQYASIKAALMKGV